MNLRRLEVRGFKTFAQPTEFLFPSGVTALVGPNGSGKSNVADAIRWVLGEQSLRAVRGKRTEDVIFAGNANRSPAGMAEVSITLDNSAGWLPVSFSEIKVSRRAYRSGENEYLLNNSRVRLRDLNDLLLKAGIGDSAYVVVGQGMADLALSLRPEERRALIDEAADIKRFYVKLHEAKEKLAVTEQALERARDLVADIAPRMQSLAEQAARLRQHQQLEAELLMLLRHWYYLIRDQLGKSFEAAEARLRSVEAEGVELRSRLDAVAQRRRVVDTEQSAAAERLERWQGEASQLRQRAEALRRESAVLVERQQAQRKRHLELQQEWTLAQRAHEESRLELLDVEAGCVGLEADATVINTALLQSEERHAAELQKTEELMARLLRAREEAILVRERAGALRDRCRALQTRSADAAAEEARRQEAVAASGKHLVRVLAKSTELQHEVEDLSGKLASLAAEVARRSEENAVAEDAIQQLTNQSRQIGRELEERRARLDVLERWRDSYGAYSGGVRAVLQAASAPKGGTPALVGIVGVVADLVTVPVDLETAIEVALGGRTQDIVVERWNDAEAAIAMLKRGGAGRATFLPLDTLRVANRAPNQLALREKGVRGVAADLVESDRRYQPVVELLLGRTLVTESLVIARRVLIACPGGWQIVTLDGEIVRTTGAVTGGSRKGNEAGLLARQRELRTLKNAAALLASKSAEVAARLAQQREAQAERRRQMASYEEQRRACELALRRREAALLENKAEARIAAEDNRRAEAAAARQAEERARIEAQLMAGNKELVALVEQSDVAQQLLRSLESEQSALDSAQRSVASELAELRTALAVKQREMAARRDLLSTLHSRLKQAAVRMEERQGRLAELAAAEQDTASVAGTLTAQLANVDAELSRLVDLIDPTRGLMSELGATRRALEEEAISCRERLAVVESACREAAAGVGRVREQVDQAHQQTIADLGAAVALEIWSGEAAVGDQEEGMLPQDEVKRRLDRARAAMRGLGMVNPLAIAEHEETAARYEFLTREVADTEEAIKALKSLSAELQTTMRCRFHETFVAVGGEFRRYFTRLFGGGTARLVLTEPEDLEQTGIEIVAQPPGRRLQNLSLLSGGERALTAVALLFAVLAVRPIPFCVLDEVDAALDEANVGRFCEALSDLSQRTQFLVVTHNRGTMQVADCLYGITMPTDSISQAVSLRMTSDGIEEDVPYVRSAATPR